MAWDNIGEVEGQLSDALTQFNWSEVAAICRQLIGRINSEETQLPERDAKRLLQKLRRKRQFQQMALLAEALIQSGQRSPQIRRQYAQALIDQGILTAPEVVLQAIIQDSQGVIGEEMEARGLIGRIYKQLYVNTTGSESDRNRANLERAINEYHYVYRLAPQQNLWHGINVVALVERARRDKLPLQGLPDASKLARDILATLDAREQGATEALPSWDVATALEALIALDSYGKIDDRVYTVETGRGMQTDIRVSKAEAKALEYGNSLDADAFEIASTLRQLTEVWQLNDREPPGSKLMPILRAALLRREAGAMKLDPKRIQQEKRAVEDLERVFGPDRTQTLKWYKKGLGRCASIGRVERVDGKGFGTGWLVKASDFFPEQNARLLLLTNAHVLSRDEPKALKPEQARVNFQVQEKIFEMDRIVWSSPVQDLDATFVSLKGDVPGAEPLPVDLNPVEMDEPPPRMYIIGHPGGRDLEFSLQDNHLVGCNERLLHYRSPTEPGSSGSPVFEPLDWNVVALHHAGKFQMDRIDGVPGTYEANEGISILAIQKATRKSVV